MFPVGVMTVYPVYSLHVCGKGFLDLDLHVDDKASMCAMSQFAKLEGMSALQVHISLPLSYSAFDTSIPVFHILWQSA